MKVVRAVPTETISEKLSVQRLGEALGVRHLRANIYTLAGGRCRATCTAIRRRSTSCSTARR